MNYSRIIQSAAVSLGVVYSLGYLSPRLRHVIDDQVPFAGVIALFIWGACVGLYAACLFAPSAFLASANGRNWMMGMSGTDSPRRFRSVCVAALLFFLSATCAVLYYVLVFMRD
jgi:hypothetical protein